MNEDKEGWIESPGSNIYTLFRLFLPFFSFSDLLWRTDQVGMDTPGSTSCDFIIVKLSTSWFIVSYIWTKL